MKEKNVAVIGLGIMGKPIAKNLLAADYSVNVYNRTASKAEELLSLGATQFDTPASAAQSSDIVITCVSDTPDVEAIYLHDDGVVHGVKQNTLCIDMSTVAPAMAKKVAGELQARECAFLDAPVSGGKNGAEAGTLSIMVGGHANDVARAQPIFDVLGKTTTHAGPVGNGQLTKLCNQILCGLNLLAVSEAVVFAKQMGLDVHTTLKAVSGGAAGSWAVENLGPRMVDRAFAPMFMVDLQQKDLRLVMEAAGQATLPLPGTALVTQLLMSNQAAGEGEEGTQALIKIVERLASIDG